MNQYKSLGRLHVITDEVLQTRLTHAQVAERAIAGGADVVQYREKRPLLTRELIAASKAVAGVCDGSDAALIVDDRVDVAFAVGAKGVHLGRRDLDVPSARALLGQQMIIGGTANSIEEARTVFAMPVDYLGVGPVFGTASKANPAPVLGLERLREIVAESPVPVIAIGNITPDRVADVLATGAHGVAVLSAITCAEAPDTAAREFAAAISAFLGGKQ